MNRCLLVMRPSVNRIPSIEPFLCLICRLFLRFTPSFILRYGSYILRYVLIYLLCLDRRFSVKPFTFEGFERDDNDFEIFDYSIQEIQFDDKEKEKDVGDDDGVAHKDGKEEDEDVILYIHGGGFNLCDSSDILLARTLLPKLCERLATINPNRIKIKMKTKLYSLKYETCSAPLFTLPFGLHEFIFGNPSFPPAHRIYAQALHAFDMLQSCGKRVVVVMGDSAGGNIALSLNLMLQHRAEKLSPKHIKEENNHYLPSMCLISPWLDVFSVPSIVPFSLFSPLKWITEDIKCDIISPQWIHNCREFMLGSNIKSVNDLKLIDKNAFVFADELLHAGVRVVAFDMDLCMVAMHSHGYLRRNVKDVREYTNRISYDFISCVRALHQRGIKLAIATHSDTFEHGIFRPINTYILGESLVRACLTASVPELLHDFFIVAYNPTTRGNRDIVDAHKKKHIRDIATHFGVARSEVVLFDNDIDNCKDSDGSFSAYQVDANKGFELQSALFSIVKTPPICKSILGIPGGTTTSTTTSAFTTTTTTTTTKSSTATISASTIFPSGDTLSADYYPLHLQVCPGLSFDKQLECLPPCLIIAGENEVLFENIHEFVCRTRNIQQEKSSANISNSIDDFSDIETTPERNFRGKKTTSFTSTRSKLKMMKGYYENNDDTDTDGIDGNKNDVSFFTCSYNSSFDIGHSVEFVVGSGDVHCYPMMWMHPVLLTLEPLGLSWLYKILFKYRVQAHMYYKSPPNEFTSTHLDQDSIDYKNCLATSPQAMLAIDAIAIFLTEAAVECVIITSPSIAKDKKEKNIIPKRDISLLSFCEDGEREDDGTITPDDSESPWKLPSPIAALGVVMASTFDNPELNKNERECAVKYTGFDLGLGLGLEDFPVMEYPKTIYPDIDSPHSHLESSSLDDSGTAPILFNKSFDRLEHELQRLAVSPISSPTRTKDN
jgi:hypothetical protein